MSQIERSGSGNKIRDFCGRLAGETPLAQVYSWYLNSSLARGCAPGSEIHIGYLERVPVEFRIFYGTLDRAEKIVLGRLVSRARESLPNVDALRAASLRDLGAMGFRAHTAQQLKDIFEPIDSPVSPQG